MKKFLSLLRFTFSVSLLAWLCYMGIVYALNTWDTGYQVTNNQTKDITLQDLSCRRITNNNTNRFIPTKTMAEWNAFNAVAGGQGVSVWSCAVNCSWYWSYDSQATTCWGTTTTYYYTYYITQYAENGWASCPYSNWQSWINTYFRTGHDSWQFAWVCWGNWAIDTYWYCSSDWTNPWAGWLNVWSYSASDCYVTINCWHKCM